MENTEREYFDFLDNLRDFGVTNMFGATNYLRAKFKQLTSDEAKKILLDWMNSKMKESRGD